MKPQMQWSYLFKHWFATLLIAPVLCQLYAFVNEDIALLIVFYPITLLVSFLYSLPIVIIYTLLFYYFWLEEISIPTAKIFFISIAVTGTFITFSLINLLKFPFV